MIKYYMYFIILVNVDTMIAHLLINQISTSATNEKLGCLKFSMEIVLG